MLAAYEPYRENFRGSYTRGLGDAPATISVANLQAQLNNLNPTAKDIVGAAQQVASQLGMKPTNKTLNEVSSLASQVASLGIPVISSAAGIVAGAALVLSSIFGDSDKPNPLVAENDQLRDQIRTIDDQTAKVTQSLNTLSTVLKQNGLNGTPADWAKQQMAIQAANGDLQNQLVQKAKNLQALIQNFNTAITQTYNAVTGKDKSNKIILGTLLAIALLGLGWFGYEKFIKK